MVLKGCFNGVGSKGIILSGEALREIIPYLNQDSPTNVIVKLQLANIPIIHRARNVMIDLLESGKLDKAAGIALQYRPRGQYVAISHPLLNALSKTDDIESFVKVLHVTSSSAPTPQEDVSTEDGPNDDNNNINEVGRILKTAVKIVSRKKSY